MKKKLLIMLGALMLILSHTVSAQTLIDIEPTDADYDKIAVINALNIMDLNSEGGFAPESNITRAELAKIAAVIYGADINADASSSFEDVTDDTAYNEYIAAASAYNLMQGTEGNKFEPEALVTRDQFNAVVIRLLGYEEYAGYLGGFPKGYNEISSMLGISKYLRYDGEHLTRRSAAVYLYESLNTTILDVDVAVGNDLFFSNEGEDTLFEKCMNITKMRGYVSGNEISALPDGERVGRGRISFNGMILNVGDTDIRDQLGRYVEVYAYLNAEGQPETVAAYIIPHDYNSSVTIKAKDVDPDKTTLTQINVAYEGMSRKYRLDNERTVVYNGEVTASYTDEIFENKLGELTLTDIDGNGLYDLIVVSEPISVIFNSYYADTGNMSFKFGSDAMVIESDSDITVYIDGEKSDMSSLTQWMSLLIYKPENSDVYVIKASSKVKSGIYNRLGLGALQITIGDETMPLAPDFEHYMNKVDTLHFGEVYTFIVNANDEIVAVMESSTRVDKYAYLYRAYVEDGGEVGHIKMFTEKGENVDLTVKGNFKLNDGWSTERYKSEQITDPKLGLMDALGETKKQLIRYKTNSDGLVSEIFLAKNMTASSIVEPSEEFALNMELTSILHRYNTLAGLYYVNPDNVILFKVPGEGGIKAADDVSKTKVLNKIADNKTLYNVQVYDVDDLYTVGAMVMYEEENVTSIQNSLRDAPLSVVVDIKTAVLKSGETGLVLDLMCNGEIVQLEADPNLTHTPSTNFVQWTDFEVETISDLKPGDVITTYSDNEGMIDAFYVFGDLTKISDDHERCNGSGTGYITLPGRIQSSRMTTFPGTVSRVEDKIILVGTRAGNGELVERVFKIEQPKTCYCYVYDTERETIELSDVSAIREGDKVFIRTYDYRAQAVIVVR